MTSARDTTYTGLHPHRVSALVSTQRGGVTASTFVRPIKTSRTPHVLDKPLASTSSPRHRDEDLDRVHQGSRSPASRSARLTRSPSPTRSARYSLHDSAETSSPDNILSEFHARCSNVVLRPSVSTRSTSTRPQHPNPTRSAATVVDVQARLPKASASASASNAVYTRYFLVVSIPGNFRGLSAFASSLPKSNFRTQHRVTAAASSSLTSISASSPCSTYACVIVWFVKVLLIMAQQLNNSALDMVDKLIKLVGRFDRTGFGKWKSDPLGTISIRRPEVFHIIDGRPYPEPKPRATRGHPPVRAPLPTRTTSRDPAAEPQYTTASTFGTTTSGSGDSGTGTGGKD